MAEGVASCSNARAKRPYTETTRQSSLGAFHEQGQCEKDGLQGGLHKRANLEVSALPFFRRGIDRAIPFGASLQPVCA